MLEILMVLLLDWEVLCLNQRIPTPTPLEQITSSLMVTNSEGLVYCMFCFSAFVKRLCIFQMSIIV